AVTSPTFTLIHEHRRPQDDQVLYHVDCYRLHGAEDAWNIGLDDLLASGGPVVIEWPENVQEMLPDERLWIAFTILDETSRQLSLTASGARSRTLQNALRQQNLGG
ncbi:MAG: tRNA (adenosine(37)-N6)-threonylcarbamoyltransferase complex ATPase subunit type 1 TsaE, partial [Chloroflexi bacterium]|nr:tRNA (adenosine(37)-N6)-threonylcarbamoyltransferase complex ATPase subunit type 1 TsaE [Chloroflexota bacterium]